MDAFIGSWKLQKDRSEGQVREYCEAIGIPAQHMDMFLDVVYTLTIDKQGDDEYRYTFTNDQSSHKYEPGSFKFGEQFEFFQPGRKKTELTTITMDGDKTREVTVLKEDPSVTWTTCRSVSGDELTNENECNGFRTTSILKRC